MTLPEKKAPHRPKRPIPTSDHRWTVDFARQSSTDAGKLLWTSTAIMTVGAIGAAIGASLLKVGFELSIVSSMAMAAVRVSDLGDKPSPRWARWLTYAVAVGGAACLAIGLWRKYV